MGVGKTKILITGIGGFAGRHLALYLGQATDAALYGTDRVCPPCIEQELGLEGRLQAFDTDMMDADRVRGMIDSVRPDWIFHLAAQAFVPTAFADPTGTLVNNIVSQVNLFQAVLHSGGRPRILVICSNEEYGLVEPDEIPISEKVPFRPANPYAVSKVAQDMLAYQYHVSHGLDTVRVRPFNHIGPGQSDRFVASDFARQIAEAELGRRAPVLRVGNLDAQRDFTDVRDMMRGYHLALQKGVAGDVYNLGSGRAVSIQALLDMLIARSSVPLQVERDQSRVRPADTPVVVADSSKFSALTGWSAEIPLERTLSDLLEYWRGRLNDRA